MRTVILLGLVYIGDAVGKPDYIVAGDSAVALYAIVLLFAIAMDIVDFIRNKP